MMIDDVSENIIKIALYANKKYPGLVSEIWLDKFLKTRLLFEVSLIKNIQPVIDKTKKQIKEISDNRRKAYLEGILNSLAFQIASDNYQNISYSEFSKNVFGFEIKMVSEKEINKIETKIKELEENLRKSVAQVYSENLLKNNIYTCIEKEQTLIKKILPDFVTNFPDKGFQINLVSNKPWSAFNRHIAAFESCICINTDIPLIKEDIRHILFHEGYGGHHSELSHKDKFLLSGQGEHGIIVTYSPQAFVSEGIAEKMLDLYNPFGNDEIFLLARNYDKLTYALQNLVTFLFFDSRLSINEIMSVLDKYYIMEKTKKIILNFLTNNLYGRYSPVYYSAERFLSDLYIEAKNKDAFVETLFTMPCTPDILNEEFLHQ